MSPEMNAKEICALIKSCGESGVTELTFGTLSIRFAPKPSAGEYEATQQVEEITQNLTDRTLSQEEDQKMLLRDELALKEERLAMALLEDPVEFEKLLAAGELEE